MGDKRIEEILKRREDIDLLINRINLKIKSLKETKEYYENCIRESKVKEGIENSEDNYEEKLKKIKESISSKETQKKELERVAKELSKKIRTFKGSSTKIKNKEQIVKDLSSGVIDINNEINNANNEKLKKLRELQKSNISKFKNLRNKIAKYEELKKLYQNDEKKINEINMQIDVIKKQYDQLEEAFAKEFGQICEKYDTIKSEKSNLIKEKVAELKRINKSFFSFQKTIEKNIAEAEEIIKGISFTEIEEDFDKISEENKQIVQEEMQKLAKTIDNVKNKEETKNTQEDDARKYEQIMQEDEFREKETQIIEDDYDKEKEGQLTQEDTSKAIEIDEKTDKKEEKKVSEIIEKNKKEEEKTFNENQSPYSIEKSENIEIIYQDPEVSDLEVSDILKNIMQYTYIGGPIYSRAYADMIKRNGPTLEQPYFYEVAVFLGEKGEKNTLVYNKRKEKTIKRITVFESNNSEDENGYVEIDGCKYPNNRNLNEETRSEVDYMCKNVLNVGDRMSFMDMLSLKKLKSKIDPVVVNAIKQRLEEKKTERKNMILRNVRTEKIPPEITEKLERIDKKFIYEYEQYLYEYILAIFSQDIEKVSFYLTYNYPEKISTSRYWKISQYINAAESAGAIVVNKQSLFDTMKGLFMPRTSKEIQASPKSVEGDKSFVQKVNTTRVAASKGYKAISNNARGLQNDSINIK